VNLPLIIAGMLTISLGLVHSYAGEQRLFREMADKRGIASEPLVSPWQLQVLRASWHTLSLFGFGLGAVLLTIAIPDLSVHIGVIRMISLACLAVGLYWAWATRFWHLAWVAFLLVAALCWWA
jgi:hypothetical protein